RILSEKLRLLDPAGRGSPPSSEKTGAILLDNDISTRRALILALGTYGAVGLPVGEKEALGVRLLELYRQDPHARVHGAAEWTLRRWGLGDRLLAIDADLKGKDRGDRRWYLNKEGQTFAVIDGPSEFRMGSPATDTERDGTIEPPSRIVIPRSFAIATKEVTIEQFQQFVKAHREYKMDRSIVRYSPVPNGPWINAEWYAAVTYCNWLSEREGLPRDEWCYIQNPNGSYSDGMKIPANVTERTGYRLPTEAEWEYAGRAGAATSRYYGDSLEFLGQYAWYQANSQVKAHPCGQLLPNDLGLFDMLGNAYEWCQDRDRAYRPSRRGLSLDVTTIEETVVDGPIRMFRGGSFTGAPDEVRSAARSGEVPDFKYYLVGFRLARTLKPRR